LAVDLSTAPSDDLQQSIDVRHSIDLPRSVMLTSSDFADLIHSISDIAPDSRAVTSDGFRSSIGVLKSIDLFYSMIVTSTGFTRSINSISGDFSDSIGGGSGGFRHSVDISKSMMFAPHDFLSSIYFGSNHISETFKSIDIGFRIRRPVIRIFGRGSRWRSQPTKLSSLR
jgi:hypothetical protein